MVSFTEWLYPAGWRLDVAALGVAAALDLTLPEPPSLVHPVVWMGKVTGWLERRSPFDGLPALVAGLGIAVVVPLMFAAAAGWAALGLHKAGAVAYVIGVGLLLRTTFTVRGVSTAALAVAVRLEDGDMEGARTGLRSLVSRDRSRLTTGQIAGAAVESAVENTTDSFVAPWLAFALLGLPGAVAYRAINTLDAMIGYRGRYEYLGKASARLDDVANLAPARLSGGLVLASGAAQRLDTPRGWRTMWRDHAVTASPNAGWTMSATAGLLGVQLEKTDHYVLGRGYRQPEAHDIRNAVRVVWGVAALGLALAAGLIVVRGVSWA